MDPSQWQTVNTSDKKVEVVLFEGWCVGFRALTGEQLEDRWNKAKEAARKPGYEGRLGNLDFDSVKLVNDELKKYDAMTL